MDETTPLQQENREVPQTIGDGARIIFGIFFILLAPLGLILYEIFGIHDHGLGDIILVPVGLGELVIALAVFFSVLNPTLKHDSIQKSKKIILFSFLPLLAVASGPFILSAAAQGYTNQQNNAYMKHLREVARTHPSTMADCANLIDQRTKSIVDESGWQACVQNNPEASTDPHGAMVECVRQVMFPVELDTVDKISADVGTISPQQQARFDLCAQVALAGCSKVQDESKSNCIQRLVRYNFLKQVSPSMNRQACSFLSANLTSTEQTAFQEACSVSPG